MSEEIFGEESSYENGLCQYAQKITACFGGMGKANGNWCDRGQYVVEVRRPN